MHMANVSYLGNKIGSEGAQALAEVLKQNTTPNQLNLGRTSKPRGKIKLKHFRTDVDSKGAQALTESLKHNSTPTQMNLESMSHLDEKIDSEGAQALDQHVTSDIDTDTNTM